jgi:hypothetical protein
MSKNLDFPFISKELLNALEEHFPLRKADIKATEREVWAAVGRQDVLDFLKHKYSIQLELSVESSIRTQN